MKNESLRLSLKYNFVTPLTSMVVTKPTKEKTEVLHKPSESGPPPDHRRSFGMSGAASMPRGTITRSGGGGGGGVSHSEYQSCELNGNIQCNTFSKLSGNKGPFQVNDSVCSQCSKSRHSGCLGRAHEYDARPRKNLGVGWGVQTDDFETCCRHTATCSNTDATPLGPLRLLAPALHATGRPLSVHWPFIIGIPHIPVQPSHEIQATRLTSFFQDRRHRATQFLL